MLCPNHDQVRSDLCSNIPKYQAISVSVVSADFSQERAMLLWDRDCLDSLTKVVCTECYE